MGKYIKSYSNYILETKRQQTNDGTIYERDITTIGGRDQFARGQVPIYKTGNFVITINNDNSIYKKVNEKDWHRNENGEVWTLDTLSHYQKDEKSSYDKKIVIKKDYYDLRDYAYYGSCSELIRVSIEDIIKRYPGELFAPYETIYTSGDKVQYTKEAAEFAFDSYEEKNVGLKGYYTSFENRTVRKVKDACGNDVVLKSVSLIDPLTKSESENLINGNPYTREFKYITDKLGNVKSVKSLALIDNPFGINMHSTYVPEGGDHLKYFANNGIENYVAYIKENKFSDDWQIDKDHEYSIEVEDIVWDGLWDGYSASIGADYDNNNCSEPRPKVCSNINVIITANETRIKGCSIDCIDPGKYLGKMILCFRKNDYTFRTIPGLQRNPDPLIVCCDGVLDFSGEGGEGTYTDKNGNNVTGVTVESFKTSECKYKLTVYMFMGNNNEVKYLVEDDVNGVFPYENFQIRIRPKQSIIEEYFNSLDLFEKVILNRDSDPIYTANFELVGDNDYGMYTYTKQFTFPTTYGGYNLGSNNEKYLNYVKTLSDIGEYYDDLFTDNLWRSMTHESIKNFDWTYTRHYTPGEEEPFVEAGTKIQKVIRLYGREFDEVNTYIDAIDDLNTVTYDNVNNLPDYFFTDKLSDYGWDVKLVYPLKLSEFVYGHDFIPIDINKLFTDKYNDDGEKITTAQAELMNYFYDSNDRKNRNKITIQRVFNQDFNTVKVKPYSCENISYNCLNYFDTNKNGIVNCNEKINVVASKEVKNNKCFEPSNVYCDETEFTSADVNSEFMKRFIINSPDIIRHKGTIEGIEMLLSLFGLRSKNSIYNNEKYFVTKSNTSGCYGDSVDYFNTNISTIKSCEDSVLVSAGKSSCLSLTCEGEKYFCNYKNEYMFNLYDYDIKEYTLFTTRQEDEWIPSKNMYKFDWVNSTKLVTYGNNGRYVPYQGLPISYTDEEVNGVKKRYLYPHFNTSYTYDGNPYYQMKGGWLAKYSTYGENFIPFMFDIKNNIVTKKSQEDARELFTETVKNIKCVNTIQDLLSNPSLATGNGDLCQVLYLSGRYAIIDGYVYTLYNELTDEEGSGNTFFYATIENNSLSVGNAFFTEYVVISNPYYPEFKQRIDLTDENVNNSEIKIYILKNEEGNYDVDVFSKDMSISTFTIFENGKYMDGDNFTNYFMINNVDYYNELSVLGWQQLRDDEFEYYRMNTITDYREGNNPHTGHMRYDNGYEYLTYFQKIFKHVVDNDLIDYRRYDDADMDYISDMQELGFNNLISENECEKNYDKFLRADNKCHYFGEVITKVGGDCNDSREGLSCFRKRELANSTMFDNVDDKCIFHNNAYTINDIYRSIEIEDADGTPKINILRYGDIYDEFGEEIERDYGTIDSNTDQIVNTKRMEIEFYIKCNKEYSTEWLEEVKYIDSVILPYLSQMIPSTVIWSVKYVTRNADLNWDAEPDSCIITNFDVSEQSSSHCDKIFNVTSNKTQDSQ